MFDSARVETLEHWWNGLWGTATRRDVWLRYNAAGPLWEVQTRHAGRIGLREYVSEDRARAALAEVTAAGPGEWTCLRSG